MTTFCSIAATFAQPVAGAGNTPTSTNKGYEYNFSYYNGGYYCPGTMNKFNTAGVSLGGSEVMDITFNGTQEVWASMASNFYNTNCQETQIDLSASNNRIIQMRISADKDVAVAAYAAVNYLSNFTYADGINVFKQLKANNFVILEFEIPNTDAQNHTLNLSNIIGWGITVRDYKDNTKKPSSAVKLSIDWIKFGDAVSRGNDANKVTLTKKGYMYDFTYMSNINYCSTKMNVFSATGVSHQGGGAAGTMKVTFNGTQQSYTTMASYFSNEDDCSKSEIINLGDNEDKKIKVRVTSSANVALGMFGAVEYSSQFTLADGGGNSQFKQLIGNVPTTLEFDIPITDWQNNALDLYKVIGWGIGVRDYNNVANKPSGAVTLTFDWIRFGDAQAPITTGIDDEKDFSVNTNIFPNPNHGKFELNCSKIADDLIVYNSMGETIFNVHPHDLKTTIDLGNINKGIYFVKLIFGEKIQTQKIIVE